jgi:DNA-binding response OmpR family regulator
VLVIGTLEHQIDDEYSFIQVTSAATAVTIAWSESPDIVIVDVSVPSAWIALRLLQPTLSHLMVPVIVVVPNDSPALRVRARQLGAAAIVPFGNPISITTVLENYVKQNRLYPS